MSIYPNYVLFKVFIVEKKCVLQFECHSQPINCSVHKAYGAYPSSFGSKQKNKQKQLLTRSHSQGHFVIHINNRPTMVNDHTRIHNSSKCSKKCKCVREIYV